MIETITQTAVSIPTENQPISCRVDRHIVAANRVVELVIKLAVSLELQLDENPPLIWEQYLRCLKADLEDALGEIKGSLLLTGRSQTRHDSLTKALAEFRTNSGTERMYLDGPQLIEPAIQLARSLLAELTELHDCRKKAELPDTPRRSEKLLRLQKQWIDFQLEGQV